VTSDEEHLRLLSIFHYIVAGITAFFGCFPIIHVSIGLFLALAPEQWLDGKGEPPPRWLGVLFAFFGSAIIAAFWTFAACLASAGWFLSVRKHYMFCLVIAALACMCQPFGTVLGVFTLIVLMRGSVKQLFSDNSLRGSSIPAGGPLV